MARFAVIVLSVLFGFGSARAEIRQFNVGDAVEMYYAASWYPGVVVEGAPGGQQGYYLVRDPNGGDHTYEWKRLRLKGQDLTGPGDLSAESTFGIWGVGSAGVTSAETNDEITRTYWGASQGALTINSDGTFEWGIDPKEPLRGRWEINPQADDNFGPVKLIDGLNGHIWWATYAGRDDQGMHTLYLRSDISTALSGFRW